MIKENKIVISLGSSEYEYDLEDFEEAIRKGYGKERNIECDLVVFYRGKQLSFERDMNQLEYFKKVVSFVTNTERKLKLEAL